MHISFEGGVVQGGVTRVRQASPIGGLLLVLDKKISFKTDTCHLSFDVVCSCAEQLINWCDPTFRALTEQRQLQTKSGMFHIFLMATKSHEKKGVKTAIYSAIECGEKSRIRPPLLYYSNHQRATLLPGDSSLHYDGPGHCRLI